jgi:hypothetical protein
MPNIIRIILTLQNPKKSDFGVLKNCLKNTSSIINQQIYIAQPETNLLYYSNDKNENIKLCKLLSKNNITTDYINKIKTQIN